MNENVPRAARSAPNVATIRDVVFTGFEPFGPHATNPSIATAGAAAEAYGVHGHAVTLPVTWDGARASISTIAELSPSCIVLFGLAADRKSICLEAVARNTAGGATDNLGNSQSGPLVRDAPASVSARGFRLGEMAVALSSYTPRPVSISESAGEYICNSTYYAALTHPLLQPCAVLFVHVPALSDDEARILGRAVAASLLQVTRAD